MEVAYNVRSPVDDGELTRLYERAFGASTGGVIPWMSRLEDHSLTWVTAEQDTTLVGFVNVIGDGGAHAVLLDTMVDPASQRRRVGRRLVNEASEAARELGCQWLHVDYEPALAAFYEQACGFRRTAAGLLRLP